MSDSEAEDYLLSSLGVLEDEFKEEESEFKEEEISDVSSEDTSQGDDYYIEEDPETLCKELPIMQPLADDPKILYSFFRDSNIMRPSSCIELIEVFSNVQYLTVSAIQKANEKMKNFPNWWFKSYFKFRHNIFASLVLKDIGEDSLMGTDADLTKYGISKTPDYILEKKDCTFLLEFTVSNNYESVDYNKGGRYFDLKYTDEAEKIQEITNKPCRVIIIPCVLSEFNMEEVKNICQNDLKSNINSVNLEKFIKISRRGLDIISTAYSKSFSEEPILHECHAERISEIKLGLDVGTRRPKLPIIATLDPEIVGIIHDNSVKIATSLMRKINEKNFRKVRIDYNMDMNRLTYSESPKGILIRTAISMFESKAITQIVENLNFTSNGKPIRLGDLRGRLPLTINAMKNISTLILKPIEPVIVLRYYEQTTPIFSDGYDPDIFDDNDFIDLLNDEGRVLFSTNYMDELVGNLDHGKIAESSSSKLLFNNTVDEKHVLESLCEMRELNSQAIPADYKKEPKQTFCMPFVTSPLKQAKLGVFDDSFVLQCELTTNSYTSKILRKLRLNQFTKNNKKIFDVETDSLRREFSSLSSDRDRIFFKLKESYVQAGKEVTNGFVRSLPEFTAINSKTMKAKSAYINKLKFLPEEVRSGLLKLGYSRKSDVGSQWKNEMTHYNRTGYSGLGELIDFEQTDRYFLKLMSRLVLVNGSTLNIPKLYNSERGPGPAVLNEQKNIMTSRYDQLTNKLKGTLLEQLLFFSEQLAKTLLKESTYSYNKNYIKADNLGFENIIVLIKGGKKIYKTNKTKLFKVFFPILEEDCVFTGYSENNDFNVRSTNKGYSIVETPWQQIHETVLEDLMTIRSRVFMSLFSNLSRRGTLNEIEILNQDLFPVLLGMHNRRKTEGFMHNCRYLIVNLLGSKSNLKGILPSFCGFNYTYFDAWLREKLIRNYPDFANKLFMFRDDDSKSNLDTQLSDLNLNHLWTDEPISSTDKLTAFIYCTYLMSKAPVTASVEQANNLESILEDIKTFNEMHPDVAHLSDESLRFDLKDNDGSVYNDDFKYDPAFCQYLGHYLAGYLKNSAGRLKVENWWSSSVNKPVDSIANSNGLRGYNKENFFNKKGYEIVYDAIRELWSNDKDFKTKIEEYLSMHEKDSIDKINSDNLRISDILRQFQINELVFHIVHKLQRNLGREIFCMDLYTKLMQNPIESFFKKMAGHISNEVISVPSDRRPGLIHSEFYEKKPGDWVKKVLSWVLDCRRWAPHSVCQKYIHFIHGMAPILPRSFLDCFYSMFHMMMDKKFVTRSYVMNVINANERFKGLNSFVKSNLADDAFEVRVKFSFVMGIFNYLSSIMHAANQLVASEVITRYCMKRDMGLVTISPFCHSDDSVLKSYHEKNESQAPTIILYDYLLKGANHMLSVKKSQINENVYLEFLSVLYLKDRLLPVIPKFTGTLPFMATDEGYSNDISFSASQSIEILTNGGTFEESFLSLKLSERYIQNFYNIEACYSLPYLYMGGLDSHPIELLIGSTESELMKHIKYNTSCFSKCTRMLHDLKLIDIDDSISMSLSWDMGSRLSSQLRDRWSGFISEYKGSELWESWTLSNCKLGNSVLNTLWYAKKLSDPRYYSSMIREPGLRRNVRIFAAFKNRCLIRNDGSLIKATEVFDSLTEIVKLLDQDEELIPSNVLNYTTIMLGELDDFYNVLDSTTASSELIPANYKEKPITFKTRFASLGTTRVPTDLFVSMERERKFSRLLGYRKDYSRIFTLIRQRATDRGVDLESLSVNDFGRVVRKMTGKDEKSFRLIAAVPSDSRVMDTYSQYIDFISSNSFSKCRFDMSKRKARILDAEKKGKSSSSPKSVYDYLTLRNAVEVLQEKGILDLDIYAIDIQSELKIFRTKVPENWSLIVEQPLKSENHVLINHFYWSHWLKEQVKADGLWFGLGIFVCNTPEFYLKATVSSGRVINMEFSNITSGFFSKPTGWYLSIHLLQNEFLSAQLIMSDFGILGKNYLGYNKSSNLWGYGTRNMFDEIFDSSVENDGVIDDFTYHEGTIRTSRNKTLFKSKYESRDRIISYFFPSHTDITFNIKKYFDQTKVKNIVKENKNLRNFMRQIALDLNFNNVMDKNLIISNIASTRIYHMIHSAPSFSSLLSNAWYNPDLYVETIINFKELNPDSGILSLDDVKTLYKDEYSPPLPYQFVQYLQRIGESPISEARAKEILYKAFTLKGEDRGRYIAGIAISLGHDEAAQALVIGGIRSSEAYGTFNFLSDKALPIIHELNESIVASLRSKNVYSDTLETLSSSFTDSTSSPVDIYELIYCKAFMDCLFGRNLRASRYKSVRLLYRVIIEMCSKGLKALLNVNLTTGSLSCIDFDVEDELLAGMFVDLLDCVCIINLTKNITYPNPKEMGKIIEKRKLQIPSNYLRKFMNSKFHRPLKLSIKMYKYNKGKKEIMLKRNIFATQDIHWGLFHKNKMVEEDEDYSEELEIEKEVMDEMFEEDAITPDEQIALINTTQLDFLDLCRISGTAKNILVSTQMISRECLETEINPTVFEKIETTSPQDYVFKPLIYFRPWKQDIKLEIAGYRILSKTELSQLDFKLNGNTCVINHQGNELSKYEFYTDPAVGMYRNDIKTFLTLETKIESTRAEKLIEMLPAEERLTPIKRRVRELVEIENKKILDKQQKESYVNLFYHKQEQIRKLNENPLMKKTLEEYIKKRMSGLPDVLRKRIESLKKITPAWLESLIPYKKTSEKVNRCIKEFEDIHEELTKLEMDCEDLLTKLYILENGLTQAPADYNFKELIHKIISDKSILASIIKNLSGENSSGTVKGLLKRERKYVISEMIKVVFDEDILGTLNGLFPGLPDRIFEGSFRIKEKTLKTLMISCHKGLDSMSRGDKETYTRILCILKFLLCGTPISLNMGEQDYEIVMDIIDMFQKVTEASPLGYVDLSPRELIELPIDIDKLFDMS